MIDAIAPYIPAISTVFNALSGFTQASSQIGRAAVQSAEGAQQAAEFRALQLDQRARVSQQVAGATAADRATLDRRAIGAFIARAAAQGGGMDAFAPSVAQMMAQAAVAKSRILYSGQEQARTDKMSADAMRYEAGFATKQAKAGARSGYLAAGASLLKTGAKSMYENYGKGSPATTVAGGGERGTDDDWGVGFDQRFDMGGMEHPG